MLSTSELFNFYGNDPECELEKHEVFCEPFMELRRSIFGIVCRLSDSDDAELDQVAHQLRAMLSSWLTMPLQFDRELEVSIDKILGSAERVRICLGSDIYLLYRRAKDCLAELYENKSPLRIAIRTRISELISEERVYRIYCHNSSKPHFEHLLSQTGLEIDMENIFITSLKEYRESELIEALIKVGPMRSRGWGALPDAVLTAPKFGLIIQYVWNGSRDEEDFGFDPVSTISGSVRSSSNNENRINLISPSVRWRENLTQVGVSTEFVSPSEEVIDELEYFSNKAVQSQNRKSTLITFSNEKGVLYHSNAHIVRIDPDAPHAVKLCSPTDGLEVGMFFVLPNVVNFDLGKTSAQVGLLSRKWKDKLSGLYLRHYNELMGSLRKSGINLVAIDYAVKSWTKIEGTVIHAPQSRANFRRLMGVLGYGDNLVKTSDGKNIEFWKAAWGEVRQSRGIAIQEGQAESELLEEEILSITEENEKSLVLMCADSDNFRYRIPEEHGIFGELVISCVLGVEDGYFPPDSETKKIIDIRKTDQWRS